MITTYSLIFIHKTFRTNMNKQEQQFKAEMRHTGTIKGLRFRMRRLSLVPHRFDRGRTKLTFSPVWRDLCNKRGMRHLTLLLIDHRFSIIICNYRFLSKIKFWLSSSGICRKVIYNKLENNLFRACKDKIVNICNILVINNTKKEILPN